MKNESPKVLKGLRCSILENKELGNCSNRGISSRCKSVTLVGPGIAEIFAATDDAPAVKLVRRNIGGEYLHIEPIIERPENVVGPMAGGAFVWTSDGRFPSRYPISLHDRFETQEQYNELSR